MEKIGYKAYEKLDICHDAVLFEDACIFADSLIDRVQHGAVTVENSNFMASVGEIA